MIIAIVLLRQDGSYNYIYKYNDIDMAFLKLTSLLDAHNKTKDDLDASLEGQSEAKQLLVPNITLGEFMKELTPGFADLVQEHFSRFYSVIYDDVSKGEDSEIYRLAYKCASNEKTYADYKGDEDVVYNARWIIRSAINFFNMDNCIRFNFASQRERKLMVNSALKNNVFSPSTMNAEVVMNDFIIPYTMDYLNPRIDFTDLDARAYELDSVWSNEKVVHKSFSPMSVVKNIPISIDYSGSLKVRTYHKPTKRGDSLYVGDANTMSLSSVSFDINGVSREHLFKFLDDFCVDSVIDSDGSDFIIDLFRKKDKYDIYKPMLGFLTRSSKEHLKNLTYEDVVNLKRETLLDIIGTRGKLDDTHIFDIADDLSGGKCNVDDNEIRNLIDLATTNGYSSIELREYDSEDHYTTSGYNTYEKYVDTFSTSGITKGNKNVNMRFKDSSADAGSKSYESLFDELSAFFYELSNSAFKDKINEMSSLIFSGEFYGESENRPGLQFISSLYGGCRQLPEYEGLSAVSNIMLRMRVEDKSIKKGTPKPEKGRLVESNFAVLDFSIYTTI
nr:MAG TPA: hypothetical protein [Caudoviricetes sp.]